MTARGVEVFFRDITRACTNAYKSLKIDTKHQRIGLGVLAAVLLVGGGYFGYRWYMDYRDRAAQVDFSSCSQLLQDVELSGAPEGWTQLEQQATRGYRAHSSSSYAPYFKVLESHALRGMGNQSAAIAAMHEAYNVVSSSNPLVGLLRLRLVLMQLDSDDESGRTQALEQLKAFASEKGAANRDGALFFLGRVYWSRGDIDQARDVWRELVELYPTDDEGASAWAREAAKVLAYLP